MMGNWDSYEVVRIDLSGPGAVYVILEWSWSIWTGPRGLSGSWWF